MSDTDSLDYLQDDFDPTTLTVPRLRSILVGYDISYPSAAKKAQLVEIFVNQVLPRKSTILRDRDRARRSSRGITNANSHSNESIQNEEPNIPLPSRTPRKSDRSSSTKLVAPLAEELPPIRERDQSPTKKKSRASSKHARTSDTETGIDLDSRRRSSRKTRKSISPSDQPSEALGAKYDVFDDGAGVKIVKRRESAFTRDNPFQSGSSPTGPLTPEKRRSLGASAIRERRKASGHKPRGRSDMPQINDGIYPPSRPTFEAPKTPGKLLNVNENTIEAGEEFTPEEQLELSQQRASESVKSHSALSQKAKTDISFSFKRPFWVVVLTLICGYAAWYRQERIAVGYCGVGRNFSPFHSTRLIPDWARIFVEPQCEPCPQHAYCSGGMQIACEHDYLLKPHPLSFGGLVPLAPTCEADGIKARRVSIVATRAVEELRERRAKFECGELKDEESSSVPSVEIDADTLKEEISKTRGKSLTEAEFEDLWAGALAETLRRDEVLSQTDGGFMNSESISASRVHPSPASPSPAPSDDPSGIRWRNIVSKLEA
ncbi:hypothetical protein K3495_g4620 [Podosphaera aphanis]|nr:hypothetical protein K3495_g4620 [Podosphaera aphanis]